MPSWHKQEVYVGNGILVDRRWAKQSEWVEIKPTANQPTSIQIYAKRTLQKRYSLRFIAAMYVNKSLQLQLQSVRQNIEFDYWLDMCVKFAHDTQQPYEDLLYNLNYLRASEPTWEKGLTMPAYIQGEPITIERDTEE